MYLISSNLSCVVVGVNNEIELWSNKVISMGAGEEQENGIIAPMPNINPGDVIIAKNPWGIGPKDEETADGKKLSFMRGQDIACVLDGELFAEETV